MPLREAAMKLNYATKAAAQARADSVHAQLIATDELYAASVAAGQTLRWAIPFEEPGGNWNFHLQNRVRKVLTPTEVSKVPEWVEGQI